MNLFPLNNFYPPYGDGYKFKGSGPSSPSCEAILDMQTASWTDDLSFCDFPRNFSLFVEVVGVPIDLKDVAGLWCQVVWEGQPLEQASLYGLGFIQEGETRNLKKAAAHRAVRLHTQARGFYRDAHDRMIAFYEDSPFSRFMAVTKGEPFHTKGFQIATHSFSQEVDQGGRASRWGYHPYGGFVLEGHTWEDVGPVYASARPVSAQAGLVSGLCLHREDHLVQQGISPFQDISIQGERHGIENFPSQQAYPLPSLGADIRSGRVSMRLKRNEYEARFVSEGYESRGGGSGLVYFSRQDS